MHAPSLMPTLFIGHGSPENALEKNRFSQEWASIARLLPTPQAIIAISAHWTNHTSRTAPVTSVTANRHPETIHDFYGFPKNFYDFSYAAPGNPELAHKISTLIKTVEIQQSHAWGLDHGTWSVLAQMYPKADIPVIQLSIDESLTTERMFALGAELGALRKEGVLILGSGNIVHNLRMMQWNGDPYPWTIAFDTYIKQALLDKDHQKILDFKKHPEAIHALPTNEHFLPLLYVLGAARDEAPHFYTEEIFASSLSMRSVVFGM